MRKQLAVFKMTKHLVPMASLSPIFNRRFRHPLKKIMVDNVNYAFQVVSLSISQILGIVLLIP